MAAGMDKAIERDILNIMRRHNLLTLATIRPDGYPQATTITFANDGLAIYAAVGKGSQKVKNIKKNNKVSLTIDHDYKDWNKIKGLSIGGTAEVLKKNADLNLAQTLLMEKFPEMKEISMDELTSLAFLKIKPEVISVLDYTKGFGHTDLVRLQ